MKFEWDESIATENLRKHGVSFDEATTVFHDPLAITYPDRTEQSPGATERRGGAIPHRRGAVCRVTKTMTLHTPGAMSDNGAPSKPFTTARDGFSLNAGVACEAHERAKLEQELRGQIL